MKKKFEQIDFMEYVKRIAGDKPQKQREKKCLICGDTGIIMFTRFSGKRSYEHVAHCICEKGSSYIYEGQLAGGQYRIPGIDEILSPEDIEKLKERALKA